MDIPLHNAPAPIIAGDSSTWRGKGHTPAQALALLAQEDARVLEQLGPSGLALAQRICHEAPGTWLHSTGVADLMQLLDSSCQLRAACLLHDVGKLVMPASFAENVPAATPRPMPGMLIAHITHGLALAHTHDLPPLMRELIAQHHGTLSAGRGETYPGPAPQTQTAGRLMIADVLEAVGAQGILTQQLAHKLVQDRVDCGQYEVVGEDVAWDALDQLLGLALSRSEAKKGAKDEKPARETVRSVITTQE